MHDTRPSRHDNATPTRHTHRVVIGCDDSRRRALMRLGLEMSPAFDVVGVAADPCDVAGVVRRHAAEVVVLSFTRPSPRDAVDILREAPCHALVVTVPAGEALRPAPFARELAEQIAALEGTTARGVRAG